MDDGRGKSRREVETEWKMAGEDQEENACRGEIGDGRGERWG